MADRDYHGRMEPISNASHTPGNAMRDLQAWESFSMREARCSRLLSLEWPALNDRNVRHEDVFPVSVQIIHVGCGAGKSNLLMKYVQAFLGRTAYLSENHYFAACTHCMNYASRTAAAKEELHHYVDARAGARDDQFCGRPQDNREGAESCTNRQRAWRLWNSLLAKTRGPISTRVPHPESANRIFVPVDALLHERARAHPELRVKFAGSSSQPGDIASSLRRAITLLLRSVEVRYWDAPQLQLSISVADARLAWAEWLAALANIDIEVTADLGIEALLIKTKKSRAILVDEQLTTSRRAFAILHEVAHSTLEHRPNSSYGLDIDWLDTDIERFEIVRQENEADALAALWVHVFDGITTLIHSARRAEDSAETKQANESGRDAA